MGHMNRFQLLKRLRSRFGLSWILFVFLSSIHSIAVGEVDCSIAEKAIQQAGELRSLSLRSRVPCKVQDKTEVRKFLKTTLEQEISPVQFKAEETLFRVFGMIPEDFDYKEGLIGVYLSQLGGYYDPKQGRYVMAGWLPGFMQHGVAVHELTHALQDQHFNLDKFIDSKSFSSDQLMARSALVEGDATLVMLSFEARRAGRQNPTELASVDALVLEQSMALMLSSDFASVPDVIKFSMLFPYASGLKFAHALHQKGGSYRSIDKAFSRPPRSTEEILHIEKYFKAKPDFETPTSAQVLKVANLSGAEVIYEDVLGEFWFSMMLGQEGSRAKAAEGASGWGGDRMVLAKDGETQYLLLQSNWDTKAEQREFMKLYEPRLINLFQDMFSREDVGPLALPKKGQVKLKVKDRTVLTVIGLEN